MNNSKVAVIGSGYMGGGIAQVLALAGRQVVLADASPELAASNRERLIREAADYGERGLFPRDAGEAVAERLTAAASLEDAVADVDLVEEAVPEILDLKHETLRRVSAACRADTLIGSNTSTISIGTLAQAVADPSRFLGVHFSNPAPFVPGVEVIPHATTDPSAVDRVVELLRECGKVGVPITDVTGFVLNRLQYALFSEAARLVDEGVATPEAVDLIARTTFGFRLPFFGPFAIADIAGLDVYDFCYGSLGAAYPDRFAAPSVLSERVERGELGVKTGRGFLATPRERASELATYRDEAYAALSGLLKQLGPAPVDY
ncbi:3-hydroxyacyl-CoA dehydrogenase family protein [Microbacterium jejuense]|uniref:3-hydroxyacyl-CoA dehydrogenase family protein n=1 Tax=Microbacterium jejuense TaxID=1263637 RepID=UPI0027E36B78|nr:3-hydroxyacyl-CoA dehydrogenase family protein [Microbacterium jejuense]